MSSVYYEFKIPDPSSARSDPKRVGMGPSGNLVRFVPVPVEAVDVVGRRIDECSVRLGTYGMGGPGFFGLRLGENWLVISIWGAGEWMIAGGRLVEDAFFETYDRPRPWISNQGEEFSEQVVGHHIEGIDVKKHTLKILLDTGFEIVIEESSEKRPVYEGSQEPRTFSEHDDLRRAVFLSPTTELWITS